MTVCVCRLRLLSGLALLAMPAMAFAQDGVFAQDAGTGHTAQAEARGVYPAEFFAQFSPATALDMAKRVPGFVIEDIGDVRGFAGAAGNVVFDGARASSKSEGIAALLARIPARRVVRMEVAPGGQFGSDFAGKSQVLNVVTSGEGGIDGNIKASVTRLSVGQLYGNVEASALIRAGGSTFNLSAGNGRWAQVERGFDDVRHLPDRTRIELREKRNALAEHNPFVSASWATGRDPARSAHVNLRYAPGHFTLHQTNHVTPATGPQRVDRLVQDYHPAKYELGGDVSRPLGGGAIKFVVLANRRERDDFDAYYFREQGATTGGFEQTTVSRYDEVLGRLTWSHPKLFGFTAEIGSELALNKLDNSTELFLLGQGGARTRIDLPVDQARVEELRSETFVNLGRQLAPRLRLDASLAFEASRLEVSGDAQAERSLKFIKPGLTLDWKHPGGWHAQLSLKRKVDQLDFYDFISSAELAADRINGGNADLQPQRTWEARLTIERSFWTSGLATLELGHDWASAIKDRVLTEEGFDAVGNIGRGTRIYGRLAIDAPLDRLGLKSVRLKAETTLQHHRVTDPITGRPRKWSDRTVWKWQAELRRDLAHWSYGVAFEDYSRTTIFRTDELDTNFVNRPFSNAFVEFRPNRRATFRLEADNWLDNSGERLRLFFDPNRSAAPAAEEYRKRDTHVALTFSMNYAFGGGSSR